MSGRGPGARSRTWLLLGGALLLVAILGAVGGRDSGEPLDPEGYGATGARATAEVLREHGVDVRVVRGADELADAGAGPGTTVLVTSADGLGESTVRRLESDTAGADLVVVRPTAEVAALLDASDPTPTLLTGPVDAGCEDPLRPDLRVEVDTALAYPTSQGCFADAGGFLLAQPRPGLLVLGAGDLLSNDQALRADNAAVAMWLLGRHDRLVWYVADPADLRADETSTLRSLLPAWLGPVLVLGALALVAVMLWRGRRLGPLVTEPLPVSVRSLETTRSRGRLYRRAGDRGHAASALRAATAEALVRRLRLPLETLRDPGRLAGEVSDATGREPAEVAALLTPGGPPPTTDRELIDLAGRLAELEREVRRP